MSNVIKSKNWMSCHSCTIQNDKIVKCDRMLKMCGWMGDCDTAVCAECLILLTENKRTNEIWEVVRFRESAGGFFSLFSDFSTVSTYLVEGEQNTALQ